MRRGFLLSLDALFALGLVLIGLSFFVLRPSFEATAASSLFLAGRDFLALGGSVESDLLRRGFSVDSSVLANSSVSVQVVQFFYPRVCGLSTSVYAACLNQSDAVLSASQSRVWVGAG